MRKSSSSKSGCINDEQPVVAQQCPDHVHSSTRQGDNRLNVPHSFTSFLEVELAIRSIFDDRGLSGEVEDPPQSPAVAFGSVHVAGSATGIAGDRNQTGCRGKVSGIGVRRHITGSDNEFRAEDRTDTGHGFDDRSLRMAAEGLTDLRVDTSELDVHCEDSVGDIGHQLRRNSLTRQDHILRRRRLPRNLGDTVRPAHPTFTKPQAQASASASPNGTRGLKTGQQHQRALVSPEVESPLERRKDTGESVTQTVDQPDSVSDEIGPMRGQQREFRGQLSRWGSTQTDHVGVEQFPRSHRHRGHRFSPPLDTRRTSC